MRTQRWTAIGIVLCGALVAPGRAEELADVEKKIVEQWGRLRSIQAKIEYQMDMDVNGQKMRSEGQGTYQAMKKDDKLLLRTELTTNMLINAGGQDMKVAQTNTMVHDGQFDYTLMETMGRKTATKTRPKSLLKNDVKVMFEQLRKDNALQLLPEAKLGDEEAYVVEAKPNKKASNSSVARQLLYFSKKSGVMLKSVGQNEKGEPVETYAFSDIKLDEKIDPARFEFKAPEGVQVVDQSKQ